MSLKKEIKDLEKQISERKENSKNISLTILLLLSLTGISLFSNLISKLYLTTMCIVCITLFLMIKEQNKKELKMYDSVLNKMKILEKQDKTKKLTRSKN